MKNKVFYITLSGELKEYKIIKKDNFIPQDGCDILIQDESGNICSGNSKNYHSSKESAVIYALLWHNNRVQHHSEQIEFEKTIIEKINGLI